MKTVMSTSIISSLIYSCHGVGVGGSRGSWLHPLGKKEFLIEDKPQTSLKKKKGIPSLAHNINYEPVLLDRSHTSELYN